MLVLMLTGCAFIADLLNSDEVIDVSCKGDDTVMIGGKDICKEYENTGHVECEVGYTIRLDGATVCPRPDGEN